MAHHQLFPTISWEDGVVGGSRSKRWVDVILLILGTFLEDWLRSEQNFVEISPVVHA